MSSIIFYKSYVCSDCPVSSTYLKIWKSVLCEFRNTDLCLDFLKCILKYINNKKSCSIKSFEQCVTWLTANIKRMKWLNSWLNVPSDILIYANLKVLLRLNLLLPVLLDWVWSELPSPLHHGQQPSSWVGKHLWWGPIPTNMHVNKTLGHIKDAILVCIWFAFC